MRKVDTGTRGILWSLTERPEDIDSADDLMLKAHRLLGTCKNRCSYF